MRASQIILVCSDENTIRTDIDAIKGVRFRQTPGSIRQEVDLHNCRSNTPRNDNKKTTFSVLHCVTMSLPPSRISQYGFILELRIPTVDRGVRVVLHWKGNSGSGICVRMLQPWFCGWGFHKKNYRYRPEC